MPQIVRSLFRFRVSTLLLVITIVCIWLGIESHRARNQARAIAVLKRSGAWVIYRHRFEHKAWLDEDIAVKFAAEGTTVKFASPAPKLLLSAVGVHYFVRPAMVAVDVSENKEVMLRDLFSLHTLGQLDLSGIADGDLKDIEQLSDLRILNLCDDEITDASIPHLAKLATLLKLDLRGTSISPGGYDRLKTMLPDCEIVGDARERVSGRAPPAPVQIRQSKAPAQKNRSVSARPGR